MNVEVVNDTNRVVVSDDNVNVTVTDNGTVTVQDPGAVNYRHGQFYDLTDQTAANTTTAYPVKLATTDLSDGVTVTTNGSGDPTRITFTYGGTYNIQTSIQFENTDSQAHYANVWFRKEGSDVAASNSRISVPSKHGGDDGNLIFVVNLLVTVTDGQYVELVWQTENTAVSLAHHAAGTTPTTPVTPSVIVTVTEVST